MIRGAVALVGTRKVRHLALYVELRAHPCTISHWQPLCSASPYPQHDLVWLGRDPDPTDLLGHTTDGNLRRSMRARAEHPLCSRCWRVLAAANRVASGALTLPERRPLTGQPDGV